MAAVIPYAIAAVAAYGAYDAHQSAKEQYQAQARANDYNEAILKQKAMETAAAFNQREEQVRRANRIERGKRVAFLSQSGTGLEGSNLDVERQNEMFAEMDALNVRYQGQLEGQGLLAQSTLEGMNAGANRSFASRAGSSSYIAAAGAGLSAYYNYSPYRKGGGGVPLGN